MATPPRIFENGSFYHIYNRGNRKQQIFLNEKDYKKFLKKTEEYKKKYGVKILAFCLMPNHFHFLVQQSPGSIISRFFSDLCNSYARYFNTKYETVGSIYQGRFKSKLIDKDEYLVHVSRYIHLNPVSLFWPGKYLNDNLLAYKWSSLPYYLNTENNEVVDTKTILDYFAKKDPRADYKSFVISNMDNLTDSEIEHLIIESLPLRSAS